MLNLKLHLLSLYQDLTPLIHRLQVTMENVLEIRHPEPKFLEIH